MQNMDPSVAAQKDWPVKLWLLTASLIFVHSVLSYTGNPWWGDFGTLIVLFWAALSLWPIVKRESDFRLPALYFMLGILFYAAADLIWVILGLGLRLDPGSSISLAYFYILPNLFFVVAITLYLMVNMHRWNKIQLLLDLITVSLVTGTAVYNLFLKNQVGLSIETLPAFLYLALDTIAITIVITVLVATRQSPVKDHNISTILLALVFFMLSDGLYVSQKLNGTFIANEIPDWLYISALILLSTGIKIAARKSPGARNPADFYEETMDFREGPFWSAAWILLLPILSVLLHGIRIQELLNYALLVIFYLVASLYVQNSIAVERTLKERTEHNTLLQVLVAERTAQLQTINHMVQNDQLTGLLSRNRFAELLDQTLGQKAYAWPLHLALIDINRFRNINNLYGQEIGDQVLIQAAAIIARRLASNTLIARFGSNEFAVLFHQADDYQAVESQIRQLYADFAEPLLIQPFQIQLQIQVGIATYPSHAANRGELLQCSLNAVEQAKRLKLNEPCYYDREVHLKLQRRQEVEMALRRVDMDREFSLFYQPQYDVEGQTLLGMEALVRWDSLTMPDIGPAEFITVAEETGLILEIGRWVMRQAMLQIREWNVLMHSNLQMGINVSPLQLEDPQFLGQVRGLIEQTKVLPAWLNFEVTESAAMGSQATFGDVLKALSDLGASISIDDFGTGYSSYAYLKRYAVDYLKIDKALIDSITENSTDTQIIQAIIAMAKALKIKTVAEGVESLEQAQLLQKMGCDKIQGYVFGRPLKASAFFENHLVPHPAGSA